MHSGGADDVGELLGGHDYSVLFAYCPFCNRDIKEWKKNKSLCWYSSLEIVSLVKYVYKMHFLGLLHGCCHPSSLFLLLPATALLVHL